MCTLANVHALAATVTVLVSRYARLTGGLGTKIAKSCLSRRGRAAVACGWRELLSRQLRTSARLVHRLLLRNACSQRRSDGDREPAVDVGDCLPSASLPQSPRLACRWFARWRLPLLRIASAAPGLIVLVASGVLMSILALARDLGVLWFFSRSLSSSICSAMLARALEDAASDGAGDVRLDSLYGSALVSERTCPIPLASLLGGAGRGLRRWLLAPIRTNVGGRGMLLVRVFGHGVGG